MNSENIIINQDEKEKKEYDEEGEGEEKFDEFINTLPEVIDEPEKEKFLIYIKKFLKKTITSKVTCCDCNLIEDKPCIFSGLSIYNNRDHSICNIIYLISIAESTINKASKYCKKCQFGETIFPISRLNLLDDDDIKQLENNLIEIIENQKEIKNCLSDKKRLSLLSFSLLSAAYSIGKKDENHKRGIAVLGSFLFSLIYSSTIYLHINNPTNNDINIILNKNFQIYEQSSYSSLIINCNRVEHEIMSCDLANKILNTVCLKIKKYNKYSKI